jgi:hypothetical protein
VDSAFSQPLFYPPSVAPIGFSFRPRFFAFFTAAPDLRETTGNLMAELWLPHIDEVIFTTEHSAAHTTVSFFFPLATGLRREEERTESIQSTGGRLSF